MKNFIIYNSDGIILRTGSCPENMLDIQAHDAGEFVMEGIADDSQDMVNVTTKLVLKNARQPTP